MNEHFNSKKSPGIGALLILFIGLILVLLFGLSLISKNPIPLYELIIKSMISIPVIGFLIWCWTGTFYTINKENLNISCGPFHWIIPIHEIKTIRTDQNTIGGIIKPTMSWKCIEIDYENDKTISISPADQDRFINILKDVNKKIEIKESIYLVKR
jgi:hypothetical protein